MNFKDRIAAKKSALAPTTTSLAAAALTSIAQQAESAIVSFEFNTPTSFSSVNFNPTDGTTGGFGPNFVGIFACGSGAFNATTPGFPSNAEIADTDFLPNGSLLGSSVSYASFASNFPSYALNTNLYFGFRLNNQGTGADETHYGWAEVIITGEFDATLVRTALNTEDDQPIIIGTVPEPSVSLFGAAALLLSVSFRRRN
ncbi:MAG: hypothetical protein AAGC74_07195 [Verrucomicrobiota bacterium]